MAAARAGVRSNADVDVVSEQVAEDFANGAQSLELVEVQPDDRTGLLVGIEVEPAVGRTDVDGRRPEEDFSTADLVEQSLPDPAVEDMQLTHAPGAGAEGHRDVGLGPGIQPRAPFRVHSHGLPGAIRPAVAVCARSPPERR
jgi:hypothetical protein